VSGFYSPVSFLPEENGKQGPGGDHGPNGGKTYRGNLAEGNLGKEVIGTPEDRGQKKEEIGEGKTFSFCQNNPGKKIKPALRGPGSRLRRDAFND